MAEEDGIGLRLLVGKRNDTHFIDDAKCFRSFMPTAHGTDQRPVASGDPHPQGRR